jgi:hypothetical protein
MPPAECDKSFTRSDALAKHMRVQHSMQAPSMRGRAVAAAAAGAKHEDGDDDMGDTSMAGAAGGTNDIADELLDLAEGDGGSDSDAPPANYETQFGRAGPRFSDAELGIQREALDPSALVGEDEEAWEADMAPVLESARRAWTRRARDRWDEAHLGNGHQAASPDAPPPLGPAPGDVESEEDVSGRRRGTRNAGRRSSPNGSSATASARARRIYLIEKAKLRMARSEHERLRELVRSLAAEARRLESDKRVQLELALTKELG